MQIHLEPHERVNIPSQVQVSSKNVEYFIDYTVLIKYMSTCYDGPDVMFLYI